MQKDLAENCLSRIKIKLSEDNKIEEKKKEPSKPLTKKTLTMKKIKIKAGNVVMKAELNNSETAKDLWNSLPIQVTGNTWGDEVYTEAIGLEKLKEKNAREVVKKGEIAYWSEGDGFCIFFGKTPASKRDEIRAASPVNVLGKLLGNPEEFKKVKGGTKILIEKA